MKVLRDKVIKKIFFEVIKKRLNLSFMLRYYNNIKA